MIALDDRTFPPDDQTLREFYRSPAWTRLAYERKIHFGWHCQCCGASADDGVRIVSDHIRPVRFYWHLRLEISNVQILCEDCNLGKASWDETDYRQSVKQRMLDAVDDYMTGERGSALKNAITSAYSFGAMSAEDAAKLIHENGLVHV